jgi:hypothetical protein
LYKEGSAATVTAGGFSHHLLEKAPRKQVKGVVSIFYFAQNKK